MPSFSRVDKIGAKPPSPHQAMGERARKILEMIKSGRCCTVDGLAREFNLSKSHLQHLFRRQTGFRLGHLLIEQKLRRAAHLLQSSKMPIKQIACAVGYEHTSSFTRAFERRFAEPPQAYRQYLQSLDLESLEMLTQSLEMLTKSFFG